LKWSKHTAVRPSRRQSQKHEEFPRRDAAAIYLHGRDMLVHKGVLAVTQHEGRLAHAAFAEEHNFELMAAVHLVYFTAGI
jgi:hypothetical protein